jgi:uncharacterized protein with PhoU and TrkA domain
MSHVSPSELARRSLQVRQATKQLRRALASGELTIATVMLEQPAALGERTLFEILLMARGVGRARLRELNSRAIDEAVNLADTLNDADLHSRRWVAANALRRSPLGAWQRLML